MLLRLILILLCLSSYACAGTQTAASCSRDDVASAIASAVSGDDVVVPRGTCTWTSGVNISGKAIHLRGESAGAVTLINGANADLLILNEATDGHIAVSDLVFDGPRANGEYHQIRLFASPSGRAALIDHNVFNGRINAIRAETNRGVIHHNTFDAGTYTGGSIITTEAVQHTVYSDPESWARPSTMGSADKTGESNLYFEDNTIVNHHTESIDTDANSRIVIRHNQFINSAMSSHGQDTSAYGTRHWEVYENTFSFAPGDCTTFETAPLDTWFFIRGGTGVIFNNTMPDINSCMWGDKAELKMMVMQLRHSVGVNACWTGGYPVPRQVGQSHDGVSYITDPVYIWNNAGLPATNPSPQDYAPDECGSGPSVSEYIQQSRDYILSPKPNYTPFQYPHPLAATTGYHSLMLRR